jgi:hypothetical protein
MTTTVKRTVTDEPTRTRTRRATAAAIATDAAGAAKVAAEDVATRLPGMAAMGRSAFDDATRRIDASSDEMVRLGTAAGFGFAVGLLVGGANRLLVGAAFVPVGMLGMALLERSTGNRTGGIASKGVGGL